MTATPPSAPTRRRGDALLEAIHAAVIEELAEYGYGALSIERVAERARTGKASIYRRWPTRLDLVADTLDRLLPDVGDVPDTGSVRDDLVELLGRFADSMNTAAGGAARVCLLQLKSEPELCRRVVDQLMPPRRAVLLAVLERAARRGEIRPEAVCERIADLGPMLLHGEVSLRGGPLTPEAVRAVVDEVLVPVLRPSSATSSDR